MAYFLTGNCSLNLIVCLTFIVCVKATRLKCPMNVNIEKGNNMTISCLTNITGLSAAYWYKNNPSLSGPMLRMEEGKPGGLEYQKENYDITSAGDMVIINADANQEAIYWFLAYFKDEIFEQNYVAVNITTTPYHSCPVIDGCPSCSQCSKVVNQSGTLKCSITESRPQITVKWIIKSGKEIEIFNPTFLAQNDIFADTWNTSTEISFSAPSCNGEVVLQCLAQDALKLLKTRYSQIKIYTENCTVSPADVNDILPKPTVIVVAVACAVIFSMLFISVICLIHFLKKKQKNRKDIKDFPQSEYILKKQDNEHSKDTEQSIRTDYGTRKSKAFVASLKDAYRESCFYKLLPLEKDKISVEEFYTPCLYEVTSSDGNSLILSTDQLLADKNIKASKLVLLQGDSGTGKTMLFKHFLQTWIANDSNFILIFASLCGATEDTELINIIQKTTETQNKLTTEEVYEVIKSHRCLLLLDGLDQMSHDEKSGKSKSEDVADDSGERNDGNDSWTIKNVIRADTDKGFANVNVWISTRDIEYCQKYELYPCCKLKFAGLHEDNISPCIRKSCSHYKALAQKKFFIPSFASRDHQGENEDDVRNTNDILSDQTSIKEQEREKLIKKSPKLSQNQDLSDDDDKIHENVLEFLENNDIIGNFKEIPRLLFLSVHITSAQFVRNKFQKTVNPWNIVTLIEILIKCLCLEEQYQLENGLREFLEQTAFMLTFKDIAFSGNDLPEKTHDQLKNATAIPILRTQPLDNSKHNIEQNGTVSETITPYFTNKFFQDFFCACAIVKNPKLLQVFKENVSKCKEREIRGLIKFLFNMHGTTKSFLKEFCNICINSEWVNNVIECLFEGFEPEEEREIIKKIKKKVFKISDLENNYHRTAVTSFCKKCKEIKVQLKEMKIFGPCAISFLQTTDLSSSNTIYLIHWNFTKEELVEFLTKVAKEGGTKDLRFVECKMEDLSSEVDDVKELKKLGLKVYKIDKANERAFKTLNYDTGKWHLGL